MFTFWRYQSAALKTAATSGAEGDGHDLNIWSRRRSKKRAIATIIP
jgi:hypothetical protein